MCVMVVCGVSCFAKLSIDRGQFAKVQLFSCTEQTRLMGSIEEGEVANPSTGKED